MNPRQITLVDSSRPTLLQSEASPAPSEVMARFLESVCGQGDCLHLRPQERVPLPPANTVIVLREACSQLMRCHQKENCRYWIF